MISISHGLYFHTRLYSSYLMVLIGAPDDSGDMPVSWGSVAARTPPSVWGCLLSLGGGDMGQELPGRAAAESKEQGDLWASLWTRAVSNVLIHLAE